MNFGFVNEILLAIIIGVTQGITEFLPISSTAHMRLVSGLIANNRDFGVASSNIIQLGTLLSIAYYFADDLKIYFQRIFQILLNPIVECKKVLNTFRAWTKSEIIEENVDLTLSQLAIATLPIAVFGLILSEYVENLRSYQIIAIILLFGSGIMYLGEYIYKIIKDKTDSSKPYSVTETLMLGFFQMLAIFPGVSRSGSTISGALMLGRNRTKSIRFSFLLSIPAIFLAGVLGLYEVISNISDNPIPLLPEASSWGETTIELSVLSLIIATLTAFVIGYLSLRWLLKFLSTSTFRPFIIYRIILALFLLIIFYYF
jgi:undecaprenyl-diphosphatase